jgi:hypothetical protein
MYIENIKNYQPNDSGQNRANQLVMIVITTNSIDILYYSDILSADSIELAFE